MVFFVLNKHKVPPREIKSAGEASPAAGRVSPRSIKLLYHVSRSAPDNSLTTFPLHPVSLFIHPATSQFRRSHPLTISLIPIKIPHNNSSPAHIYEQTRRDLFDANVVTGHDQRFRALSTFAKKGL
ncbi:hypothetical protein Zmor_000228 [Zophobas morio]|uniref:Uncharacterized protein n=1 Tax=Zophobas morio TaxID=2755281 RepID=A0AA38IVV3_9CUCU|nr:hypothetical protein Zmor_000228 [Zophobas morio]